MVPGKSRQARKGWMWDGFELVGTWGIVCADWELQLYTVGAEAGGEGVGDGIESGGESSVV
jgi:hypothetical protein